MVWALSAPTALHNWGTFPENRMAITKLKRALVVTGAGASLEFGIPSTAGLTKRIEAKVLGNDFLRHCGADCAYVEIRDRLAGYFHGGLPAINFEHVYHCAHELLYTFEPAPSALDQYRPILVPFIERRFAADRAALRALVEHMAKFIFEEVSAACDKPTCSFSPLADFIDRLRQDYITRVYTTNYDDVLLQAVPDLYTGFGPKPSSDPKRFEPYAFWDAAESDGVFHLHGSVHMGFPFPPPSGGDPGVLYWFDSRADALPHASFSGSGRSRMDGSRVLRTALITGLDKLSRLQWPPFDHYYARLARDALTADLILIIGSGLFDLHLNTWLNEARRRDPTPPLVFVDYWSNGFLDDTSFEDGSQGHRNVPRTAHARDHSLRGDQPRGRLDARQRSYVCGVGPGVPCVPHCSR